MYCTYLYVHHIFIPCTSTLHESTSSNPYPCTGSWVQAVQLPCTCSSTPPPFSSEQRSSPHRSALTSQPLPSHFRRWSPNWPSLQLFPAAFPCNFRTTFLVESILRIDPKVEVVWAISSGSLVHTSFRYTLMNHVNKLYMCNYTRRLTVDFTTVYLCLGKGGNGIGSWYRVLSPGSMLLTPVL